MADAQKSGPVSTKQQQIAELAERLPQVSFTALNHYPNQTWLWEAFNRARKDAAPGVDGQTADEYARHLAANLGGLLDRAKSGTYRAPPVRRVHIPKGTGPETRPLGIPTLEDKILQRAGVMVLEPLCEQGFLDCSYGFRPGRSAHQALEAFRQQALALGGGWVVEVDIRRFVDTLDQAHLRAFLQRRVRDAVLLRLLGKWLKAGILEGGELTYPEAGTPQGGVVSPLLANSYLHDVLGGWFEQVVKPRLQGRAFLVRSADDFVMGFACEEDARRVLEVLPKRFGKYSLTLHPDKTRLVRFTRPGRGPPPPAQKEEASGSFDFLGFTHLGSRSKKGHGVIKQKTARSRSQRALRKVADWCRRNLHRPIREQYQGLRRKLQGHYQYFGVVGNGRSLWLFWERVRETWQKWLSRRGGKKRLTWEWFHRRLRRLPLSCPPGWITPHAAKREADEPDALIGHVRIRGSPGWVTARGDPATGNVVNR
jgi:group II intron reverse transcriptase/maturase